MNTITLTSSDFRKGIELIQAPIDMDVGIRSKTSFQISITAETANYREIELLLYAHNSRAIPYHPQMQNNFSKLKPQWRFADINENLLSESMPITYHTELISGGDVIGAIGSVEFYYIDDMPSENGSPVLIWATIDSEKFKDRELLTDNITAISYYNSESSVIIPVYVLPLTPKLLHFDQNGVLEVNDIQWTGISIPAYATIRGIPEQSRLVYDISDMRNYPILFSYPISGTQLEYKLDPIQSSFNTDGYFIETSMQGGRINGGWSKISLTPTIKSPTGRIIGRSTLTYDTSIIDRVRSKISDIWISNQTSNTLHKVETLYINSLDDSISATFGERFNDIYIPTFNKHTDVDVFDANDYANTPTSGNPFELSGYSGIYAIAKYPINNTVWTADFELDRIQERDNTGNVVAEIDLQQLWNSNEFPAPYLSNDNTEYTWYGPNSLSVDYNGTIYSSLYNSVSCIKITKNGTSLSAVAFAPSTALTATPTPSISANNDEWDLPRPVKVVCDKNNGLHIIYGNDTFSRMYHYSQASLSANPIGVHESEYVFTSGYVPMDMILIKDTTNEDFVVLSIRDTNNIDDGIYVSKYDYTSSYSASLTCLVKCNNPAYLTKDSSDNVWFSYDGNKIGKISDLYASTQVLSTIFALELPVLPALTGEEIIGGVSYDSNGYINILNAFSNEIHRWYEHSNIPISNNSINTVKIYPQVKYSIVKYGNAIQSVSGDVPSLMAFGDYTGYTFNYTYDIDPFAVSENIVSTEISGSSQPFEVRSFNTAYGVRKFNDSFDMQSQIKSYVLPDYMKQYSSLWDDYIGRIVGDGSDGSVALGTQIYEKIANFPANHSDIYTSNIDAFYSDMNSIGTDIQEVNLNYPPELKHWVDVLSISFDKLRGEQFKCNRNFVLPELETSVPCQVCGQTHPSNLGVRLSSDYNMTIGVPIVIQDTYMSKNQFDIFYPPISGSPTSLETYGFRSNFFDEYKIYDYVQSPSGVFNKQADGVIDWEDQYNEIAIENIDPARWNSVGGYVEQIFSQVLFKNLLGERGISTTETTNIENNWNVISFNSESDIIPVSASAVYSEYVMCPVITNDTGLATQYLATIYTSSVSGSYTETLNNPILNIDATTSSGKYIIFTLGAKTLYIPIWTPQDQDELIPIPIYGEGGIRIDSQISEYSGILTEYGYFGFNLQDGTRVYLLVFEEF